MTGLNEWDFAGQFTGIEAALLIEGKKISSCSMEGYEHLYTQAASNVILSRMRSDYHEAWTEYAFSADLDGPKKLLPRGNKLPSEMMNIMAKNCSEFGMKARFEEWLADGDASNFDRQKFTRTDIQHWLDKNKFPTKYEFEKKAVLISGAIGDMETTKDEKPLATRERTTYLNIIGAMLEQLTAGTANNTTVITKAVDAYGHKSGISPRKLEEAFAAAKRSLRAS